MTDPQIWGKFVDLIYSNKDFIILGAYHEGKMAGYLIVVKLEDKYCIQHAYTEKQDSELTVAMNGLIYTLVNNLIKENGKITISYGLDSIYPLVYLNRFKSNMLFKKVPLTRVYVINPLLLPLYKMIIFVYIVLLKKKRITKLSHRKIFYIYYGHRLLKQEIKEGNI